jgi:hypothetical protein
MPGDPGELVVTNACAFYTSRTRLRVQRAPGIPRSLLGGAPRPLFRGGAYMHSSGASCRENAEMYVKIGSASLRAKRSNPSCSKGRMDCVASLAMTIHSSPPAAAGDPVTRDVSDGIDKPRRSGYSAGACHRARRRRDPVAEYDDFMVRLGCLKSERLHLAVTRGNRRYRNTIHAGAWSLAPSSPRSSRSMPALIRRGASTGLSNR